MHLSKLLSVIPSAEVLDAGDPEISGVECDSRLVGQGGLFAAVIGEKTDGHEFLDKAAAVGAAACLIGRKTGARGLVRVLVPDVEKALGAASAQFWGNPSQAMKLVGITGTNGKTTTAHLIRRLFEAAGQTCGYVGTVAYSYPSGDEPAALTTPDAPTLQKAMARMVREGAQALVMEVSSHALARKRIEGCDFDCVVFTNLGRDHLDSHGSMEAYFQAKRSLFVEYAPGVRAVINAEDPYGQRLLDDVCENAVSFGLTKGDVRFSIVDSSAKGIRGIASFFGREFPARLPLVGEFNASNAACALATGYAMGLDCENSVRALERIAQIPGRLEAVKNDLGISVLVDFAHTADGLFSALKAVREAVKGRLLCVFGCGGDRDKSKRPLMAEAAAKWCDSAVLTADNSRSESTEAILGQIEAGLPKDWKKVLAADALISEKTYAVISDRREAIKFAVNAASKGDAIVIAGKGHETTQTIGDQILPFSDKAEALSALSVKAAHHDTDPGRG